MINLTAGIEFLQQYRESAVVIAPHADVDGLAGAALIWRHLRGTRRLLCPEKGVSLFSEEFRAALRQAAPDAIIIIDQGSREGALAPGIPTLTIDHRVSSSIPDGVYVNSSSLPGESASLLCYRLTGEIEEQRWLAAFGEIADHGMLATSSLVENVTTRYSRAALLEAISLISAARRGSRYNWQSAFDLLLAASDPMSIANHELPAVAQLVADREEISRATHRARRARPFLADPWAVIPFSSPCLIHGSVATASMHRLHEHYVVAANFGYRPGFVHVSIRTEQPADVLAEIIEITPANVSIAWSHGQHGAPVGSTSRKDFLVILNHMGFSPQQTMEIDRSGMRN